MTNDDPNPYQRNSSATTETAGSVGVEKISTPACWRLVEANSLGRLAIQNVDGHPDVFPLDYLVHEKNLFMRSAPGTKLRSIVAHPEVALEIDGTDDAFTWSVVIRGTATRMNTDDAIEASGILGLVSRSPTAKYNYVRLVPDTVTGRRFPVRGPVADPEAGAFAPSERPSRARRTAADKPQPIAHLRPWGDG